MKNITLSFVTLFNEATSDFNKVTKTIVLGVVCIILLSSISLAIGVAVNGAPEITIAV